MLEASRLRANPADACRFCPHCGGKMVIRDQSGRSRPVCANCGHVYYDNPVVAAGCLVEQDESVLLIRRGEEPAKGTWGLPAGYAEAGESPEETAIRETREETGLQVAIDELLAIYPFGSPSGQTGVVILYLAHPVGGHMAPGDDADEARYFAATALPASIGFRTHREALGTWALAKAIAYREATPATIPRFAELAQATGSLSIKALGEYVHATDRVLLGAFQGDAPIGYVALCLLTDGSARLDHVFVRQRHRRFGIGTRLLRESVTHMARRGSLATHIVVPSRHPALALLIRAGFIVCGLRVDDGDYTLFLRSGA